MHEENLFYLMQDFMFSTKGITYLLIVGFLISFIFFWRFLNERESD